MAETVFWENVKHHLDQMRMPQSTLAERADVSYGLLRKWISTGTYPDLVRAVKIASVLSTTVDALLQDPGTQEKKWKSFGERLKLLIESRETTPKSLADRLAIPLETLRGWLALENGPIEFQYLLHLADSLGVTVQYLYQMDDESNLRQLIHGRVDLLSPSQAVLLNQTLEKILAVEPKH